MDQHDDRGAAALRAAVLRTSSDHDLAAGRRTG